MRRIVIGILLAGLGGGVLAFGARLGGGIGEAPLIAAGIVLLVMGVLMLAGGMSRRGLTGSWWRLDVYLRFGRRAKKGVEKFAPALPIRIVMRVAPRWLFFDWVKAKPGGIRKVLKRMGPTWLSAPVRRIVQGVCFAGFLWLLFYVCWPYDAAPAGSSAGWLPLEVDPETGRAVVLREEDQGVALEVGGVYYVSDVGFGVGAEVALGVFVVTERGGDEMTLEPMEAMEAMEAGVVEAMAFSAGPWTLSEGELGGWPRHYADRRAEKEVVEAELFLILDPLVSLSTAIAARSWVWSLVWAGVILIVCLLIPRGFCGYLCPLGTLIDMFDWAVGKRVTRFRVGGEGWWVHIKYYLLAGTLMASLGGVLLTGFVAAIPVVTRGFLFVVGPVVDGAGRGWHLIPAMNSGHFLSIGLFLGVLGLGLMRPRFWCKYVCPTGAVFSVGNLFRLSERKVEDTCISCNRCVEVCPFDAIKADFTTRGTDCTLCQTCGGVCPTHAIKFVERTNTVQLKIAGEPVTHETALGRRGFMAAGVGIATSVAGAVGATVGTKAFGAKLGGGNGYLPVRPPGSVPEAAFLQMCIRCGECFKACPNNVLQALGFEQGLEGLWTPAVKADWAGCEPSCNNCGQVCPTGAIAALPIEVKKATRMGLALVNEKTCLPFAGREDCDLCVQECAAAGYDAIEFVGVGTEADDEGNPVEGTGRLAPVVLADKCVGCGLCQTRCYGINVKEKGLLEESAIVIEAGTGREDRVMG